MLTYLVAYISSLVLMLVLDLAWLGIVAKNLYKSALGPLLADAPRLPPAITFYLLYPAGVIFFAVAPALAGGSWTQALLRGALLGFFAYMTYDFTNLALIRGWPSSIVAIDIAWGVVLTAVIATAGYFAAQWQAR